MIVQIQKAKRTKVRVLPFLKHWTTGLRLWAETQSPGFQLLLCWQTIGWRFCVFVQQKDGFVEKQME